MRSNPDRRRFLQRASAGGALLGLGNLVFVARPGSAITNDAPSSQSAVQFEPDTERLVRFLEDTPRERVLEACAVRVRGGLGYRELLGVLLLAGVRGIQPRPVGFKFHAVLAVHSAHLASLDSPPAERWLPLFWALDLFKDSQIRDVRAGDWTMAPVKELDVPPADKARAAFIASMDAWNEAAADAAATGIVRHLGARECFELLVRYGARDYRDIGHKAIYVAIAWRTLQLIGWRHAEPVVRSLAYALLDRRGTGNPAENDFVADRPWRRNIAVAAGIRTGWTDGRIDSGATLELLAILRHENYVQASDGVAGLLNRGIAPQAIIDACFLFAGELLMRRPGILAVHAVTTTNALQFAWRADVSDQTRRLLLLQNAAFLTMFREDALGWGGTLEPLIDRFEPSAENIRAGDGLTEVLSSAGRNRMRAAAAALGFLRAAGNPKAFLDAARRLVVLKGDDAHDYKFGSAALEDYAQVSPQWRDRLLASSVFYLPAPGAPDNEVVVRARAALRG